MAVWQGEMKNNEKIKQTFSKDNILDTQMIILIIYLKL